MGCGVRNESLSVVAGRPKKVMSNAQTVNYGSRGSYTIIDS